MLDDDNIELKKELKALSSRLETVITQLKDKDKSIVKLQKRVYWLSRKVIENGINQDKILKISNKAITKNK